MSRPHLKDSSILVVEDHPLIVMDISMAFESAGAHLTTTNTVKHAKLLVEHDGLSAAILDHALSDGDSSSLCTRLAERGIPYLLYSGHPTLDGPCKDAPHLKKPATHDQLLDVLRQLRELDLLTLQRVRVRIHDLNRLRNLAGFQGGYLNGRD